MQRTIGSAGVLLAAWMGSAAAEMTEACFNTQDPQGQIDACTAIIEAGSATGDELAGVYIHRCMSYSVSGQGELALADCDRAVSLAPNAPQTHAGRGNVHAGLGRLEEAVDDYDEAIRLDADYAFAYLSRAIALSALGRNELAVADFDRLLEFGIPDEALSAEVNNRRAVALHLLALEHLAAGRPEDGLPLVDEALSVRPDDPSFISARAVILCALARPTGALDGFAQAIEIGGTNFARMYQQSLTNLGHRPGPIDGLWGTNSQNALVAWVESGCPPPAE